MDKARDSWLRSIEMDQMHADAYVNLGNMELMFNQQPEKALEHYKRAEQLEPDDGEIVFNLAVTYDKLNEWEKAVETYRRAKQLLASVENPDEGVKARLERIEPMIRNAITKALASKESAERKQESQ